jgi:hypothetical protein
LECRPPQRAIFSRLPAPRLLFLLALSRTALGFLSQVEKKGRDRPSPRRPVIAASGLKGGQMIGKLGLFVGTVGLCSSLDGLVHAQAVASARLGSAGSPRAVATDEAADFQSLVSPVKYRRGRAVAHRRGAAVSRDGYCDYDRYPSCYYDGYAFTGNGLAIVGGLPVVHHGGRDTQSSRP